MAARLHVPPLPDLPAFAPQAPSPGVTAGSAPVNGSRFRPRGAALRSRLGQLRHLAQLGWITAPDWLRFQAQRPHWTRIHRQTHASPDPAAPWVIGGHRGRLYADNSGALHRYIREHTDQPVIWVTANPAVKQELEVAGHPVLWKHSDEARRAILAAPVLVYSHGNSDLDDVLLRSFRPAGLRVYLNHCMNHIKAGQLWRPDYERLSERGRARVAAHVVDFDYLLASSERERDNFALSFPHRVEDLLLGGGAHIGDFFEARSRVRSDGPVLYFPTFRDPAVVSTPDMEEVVSTLVRQPRLHQWLVREDRELVVCSHINTPAVRQRKRYPEMPRVRYAPPDGLVELLVSCSLLISDYSGVQCDYLALDKPIIHFPFDLEAYLKVRRLYVPYESFIYGPQVGTVDELVACLESGAWADLEPYAERRRFWKEQYFPYREPVYAKTSYETIEKLLNQR